MCILCMPSHIQKHKQTLLNFAIVIALPAPEPASVLGRRLSGDTGLAPVVLPRPADSTAECDSSRNPNLSHRLQCYLHEVWSPAGGTGAPQRDHAEPCQYIHWWNTRLVKAAGKRTLTLGVWIYFSCIYDHHAAHQCGFNHLNINTISPHLFIRKLLRGFHTEEVQSKPKCNILSIVLQQPNCSEEQWCFNMLSDSQHEW